MDCNDFFISLFTLALRVASSYLYGAIWCFNSSDVVLRARILVCFALSSLVLHTRILSRFALALSLCSLGLCALHSHFQSLCSLRLCTCIVLASLMRLLRLLKFSKKKNQWVSMDLTALECIEIQRESTSMKRSAQLYLPRVTPRVQGVSVPSLMPIGPKLLALEGDTYTQTY